ncbi:hypothetical protein DYB32_000756 [Aphanomyces invadans]|uniref:Pentacotripeptide-repeat region of PRORP domain-containing protein n=1 Tax=Aphanomyces invadans TaxID=157072 RepID=A0A418B905_9STRA|nr:hypothetical protein DYB32_000756 [Aphanomyces invadans]
MLALGIRTVPRVRVPLVQAASLSSDAPSKLRFDDILHDIHNFADAKKLPTANKLTALFRSVTSRQDFVEATKVLRIYETMFVDPKQQTAGEFIKAAITQDAEDLALKVFQQHRRIGMFVSTGSLNNLLLHLYKKRDHASALALFEELKLYKVKPNAETYSLVIRHLLSSDNIDQLLDVLAVAGYVMHHAARCFNSLICFHVARAAKLIKANTLNHILIQLFNRGKLDEVRSHG